MKTTPLKLAAAATALLVTGIALLATACTERFAVRANLPYLPPPYYSATAVFPIELENIYFSPYINPYTAREQYDNRYYIFKDVTVDAWLIREASKGILWADLTECHVVNVAYLQKLKIGERIDIVGYNVGKPDPKVNQLRFIDSYVLPAGLFGLPLDPGARGDFSPSY